MTGWGFTRRQWVALVAPMVLILSMYVAFQDLVVRLGFPRGYLAAFIIYWLGWCLMLPAVLLGGPRAVFDLFRDTEPRFGKPAWKSLVLLLWPLPFPLLFRFIPNLPEVNVAILLASIAIGIVIGVTEEILWRGLYVRLFPDQIWLSYLYPSVAFALWHVAPQSVHSSSMPGGVASFVLYALFLGLSYGYYARKTGSIRWCTVSHCVHDSLGLGAFVYAMWLT